MIPIKPHAVILKAPYELRDARGVVISHNFEDSGYAFSCYIEPERANVVLNNYGIDVKRPARLYADIADARDTTGEIRLRVGSRIEFGARHFAVKTPVEFFEAGLDVDHAEVILEELQYVTEATKNLAR